MSAYLSSALFWLLPSSGYADSFAAQVRQAEITLQGDIYVLSADIDYRLSDEAMEALQNGVSLFWDIQVKVQRRRNILWDQTLADLVIYYRLQYHALLNMYRVINEVNGETYNFSTLSSALGQMSAVRNFRLIDKADIAREGEYLCAVKVNFDREALPLPLRPISYIDPQWYLSSDWTLWPLKK
ncbi:MAG: DUF4390 domain-containing protein [Methylococcales bacterium]|nr:DUF4390 domain-containing protein [Methylococcales bacterium]